MCSSDLVTRAGNGTISATSSNTAVATVSVSGNKVTVTSVKKNGSATITIKIAAGTNHTAPSNKTCSVTASFTYKVVYDAEVSKLFYMSTSFYAYTDFSINQNNGTIEGAGSVVYEQPDGYYDYNYYTTHRYIELDGEWYRFERASNVQTYIVSPMNIAIE